MKEETKENIRVLVMTIIALCLASLLGMLTSCKTTRQTATESDTSTLISDTYSQNEVGNEQQNHGKQLKIDVDDSTEISITKTEYYHEVDPTTGMQPVKSKTDINIKNGKKQRTEQNDSAQLTKRDTTQAAGSRNLNHNQKTKEQAEKKVERNGATWLEWIGFGTLVAAVMWLLLRRMDVSKKYGLSHRTINNPCCNKY